MRYADQLPKSRSLAVVPAVIAVVALLLVIATVSLLVRM
jgi:hypothetical protein